ncbi:hypothetical protein Zmor_009856 [Zophobas morio]|uniref:Fucosyltransferase n=1 Tax=Zophobas morio TaxID=2755281 RepID=A0AA38IJL9_9CUCU|nr:hypothetical protein Zmor_009856 [Zophobas morio]
MLGYVYKFKIKNVFLLVLVVSGALYFVQFLFLSEVRHPVIVWWTPFMGDHERMITCSKYTCLLSKDRTHVNNKNLQAFLFYGSLFKYEDTPIPKSRIWAVFHEESPRNVALFLYQRTYDVFDITATFSRYSDFPLTLQYLENLTMITDNRYLVSLYEKNRLLDSIAPVLYVQSDCDTPVERDAYIAELMKHIQVDSFGACLNNKHFPKGIADVNSMDLYNDKLLHFIAKYKFVLAFENAICDDYITEKLWRPLVVGSVPVYLGSPSVEDWLPNPSSAILAKNFATPEELANYIHKINANDTLYETFLEHKSGKVENNFLKSTLRKGRFGVDSDQDDLIPAFECFVCQQIHEGVTKRGSKSVYDCIEPKEGNSWEYFWQSGDCQSRALVDSVVNNKSERVSC